MVATAGLVLFWRLNQVPPAPRAVDLLPDSTFFLVSCPDLQRTSAEFEHTAANSLWQEPQVERFAQDLQHAVLELLGAPKGQRDRPVSLFSFLKAARGEVFLAMTEPPPRFNGIAGLDVGRNVLVTKLALAYRELRMRMWNRQAQFVTKRHLGVPYRVWTFNPRLKVHHVFLNSLLVYSLDEETLRECSARFVGDAPKGFMSLKDNPSYRNALYHLRPAPEIVAYLNPSPLHSHWPALSWLARTDAIALGTTFLDNQVRDIGYAAYNTSQATLPALTRFQSMALTSPQTTFYRVDSTDWETSYRKATDSLVKSGQPVLQSAVAHFEETLRRNGIRPVEDLFRLLGPETALVANWREGARFPDIALVAELQNSDALRLRVDVAMTAIKDTVLGSDGPVPWDTAQFHGETLRTARLKTTVAAPTYFTTDKLLVVTLTPDYARELISQFKESAPTLATNPDYQQAMKRCPPSAAAYTYCNLPTIASPLIAHARNSLRLRPSHFVDPEKLPAAGTLARHLSPFAAVTTTGERSETTITISPLGKPVTLTLGALAAWYAARPHLKVNPIAPTTSSNKVAPPPPLGNPTVPSQTPAR
jgi:hypothetical protein